MGLSKTAIGFQPFFTPNSGHPLHQFLNGHSPLVGREPPNARSRPLVSGSSDRKRIAYIGLIEMGPEAVLYSFDVVIQVGDRLQELTDSYIPA